MFHGYKLRGPVRAPVRALIQLALVAAPIAAQAATTSFDFSVVPTGRISSGIWVDQPSEGYTAGFDAGALPPELRLLRSNNREIKGSFSWDTDQVGRYGPSEGGGTYQAALELTINQGGDVVPLKSTAAQAYIENNQYRDGLAIYWDNNGAAGALDVTLSQPVVTVLDLSAAFDTGLAATPVHVSFSKLHLGAISIFFEDPTAQVFASNELPRDLALSDFRSYFRLDLVGAVKYEVQRADYSDEASYQAALTFVKREVIFEDVRFEFAGAPQAPISTLVNTSAVPEPSTWALMLVGALMMATRARKASKA